MQRATEPQSNYTHTNCLAKEWKDERHEDSPRVCAQKLQRETGAKCEYIVS